MTMWLDVYDPTGTAKIGDGPVTSVTSWRNAARLDQAGEFSCALSAADPRAALLQSRNVVVCRTVENGAVVEKGRGIIDSRRTRITGDTMEIAGNDMLHELATRGVGGLTIKEDVWRYLGGHGAVRWIDDHNKYEANLGQAYDGDPGTATPSFDMRFFTWLYIGFDMRFTRIHVDLHTVNASAASVMDRQYFNGSDWVALPNVVDGTMVDNRAFAKDGEIAWDMPGDWARCTPTKEAGSWFWVRFRNTGTDFSLRLSEIKVHAEQPTLSGISQIMALAPAGWTIAGHTTTKSATYLQFGDETVLGALQKLAEATGEHFRLGADRAIEWLQDDAPISSVRAVGVGDPVATEDNDDVCVIADAELEEDSYSLYTRVRPYGGGTGDQRATLALATRTPPTGYTLSKADNWLISDTAEAAYGRIEARKQFDNIVSGQQDSHYVGPGMAANQLFDAALADLQRHEQPQHIYRLAVARCPAPIIVGQRLHVVYQKWLDGAKVIDINTYPDSPLWVLGASCRIDELGAWTVDLEVSTTDRGPDSDASVMVGAIENVRGLQAGQGSGVASIISKQIADEVTIRGGTIDGVRIGDRVPGSGRFTTLEVGAGLTGADSGHFISGYMIVAPQAGTLAAGAPRGATTIDFGQAMTPGDIVLIRAGGSEYVQVVSLISGTKYNVVRNLGLTGGSDWPAGTPWANFKQAGSGGRITLTSGDGYRPRISVLTQGSTLSELYEEVRIGDLQGNWGYSDHVYGAAFGRYAEGEPCFTYDPDYGIRLRIYNQDKLRLDPDGNAYMGRLLLDADGGIYQGTGTFDAPGTGLKLWNDTGIGRLAAYDEGTVQWYVDTDGSLRAGGGAVVLDEGGVWLVPGTGLADTASRLKFGDFAFMTSVYVPDFGREGAYWYLWGRPGLGYWGSIAMTHSWNPAEGRNTGYAELELRVGMDQAFYMTDLGKMAYIGPDLSLSVSPDLLVNYNLYVGPVTRPGEGSRPRGVICLPVLGTAPDPPPAAGGANWPGTWLYAKADGLYHMLPDGTEIMLGGGGGPGTYAPAAASYLVQEPHVGLPAAVTLEAAIRRSTWTDRATESKAGRLEIYEDAPYWSRANGTAFDLWGPLFPLQRPSLAEFTAVNQGSATAEDAHGMLYISAPAAGGAGLRIWDTAIGEGDFTLIACILPQLHAVNFNKGGIVIRDSSSGRCVILGPEWSTTSKIALQKYNNPNSYAANYDEISYQWPLPMWYQIKRVGAMLHYSLSRDPWHWDLIRSTPANDWLADIDRVGVFVEANNSTYGAAASVLSWDLQAAEPQEPPIDPPDPPPGEDPEPIGYLYVATNGDDSNPGTEAEPFKTIQKALDVVTPGQEIRIRGGAYAEALLWTRSGTEEAPCVLCSYPNEQAVLDGNYSVPPPGFGSALKVTADWCIIRDLEITRSGGLGLLIDGGSHNIVRNVRSHHNRQNGILVSGSGTGNTIEYCVCYQNSYINVDGSHPSQYAGGLNVGRQPTYTTVRHCTVYNNWGEGLSAYECSHTLIEDNVVYDNWGTSFYLDNAPYATVQRNLIYRSPAYAYNRSASFGMADEKSPAQSTNMTIVNNLVMGGNRVFFWHGTATGAGLKNSLIAYNTFVNSSGDVTFTILNAPAHQNSEVRNNIIAQYDTRGICVATSSNQIKWYNNVWSKDPGPDYQFTLNNGGQVGDPLLARAGSTDPGQLVADWFRLQAGSVAIGHAAAIAAVLEDFEGTVRGDPPDCGALEYEEEA